MKLLFVVHDYLPEHVGGTEIHAHQVAAELVRRGHRVVALYTERDLSRPEGDQLRGELDGVQTLEVVHQREYADLRETWLQPLAGETFRSVLSKVQPDCVHFHHLSVWGAGCLETAREAGVDTIVTLNDFHLLCDNAVLLREDGELCLAGPQGACCDCLKSHPLRPERWPRRLRPEALPDLTDGAARREVLSRAARERFEWNRRHLLGVRRAFCPSRFLAERFLEAGMLREEQVVVSKYGYPGVRRDPRRSDPGRPLRVGYVGGLYPSKGVHVLVEAFGELTAAEALLEIWGALDWFPDYVAELRAAAEGRSIEFRGRYSPEEVDQVLERFDVLVVPSLWYENMPLTIQEAFRNGLPVVTSDLGGMAEAVEHGKSGLCFERGDARALAACLGRLIEDRELLASLARGRPHVPTLEEVVDLLEGLYAGG